MSGYDVFDDKELVPRIADSFDHLADDFRSFSEKGMCVCILIYQYYYLYEHSSVFPAFVKDEEERDTTFYLALTTIATFFSSVTATTIQFNNTSNAANLLWFISLVFSVSSGVNSLLSMIWRKSHVYVPILNFYYFLLINIRVSVIQRSAKHHPLSDFGLTTRRLSSWPSPHSPSSLG